MLGFFRRKKGKPDLHSEDHWVLAEGEVDGQRLFVRTNAVLEHYIGDTDFTIKVGIVIPRQLKGSGLPDPGEVGQLDSIEDMAYDSMGRFGDAIHALTLTNDQMREMVFYVKEGFDIQGFHEMLMAKVDTHKVQCMGTREPDRATYREWGCV